MNAVDFYIICREACEGLGLEQAGSLGTGDPIELNGVYIEALFIDGQDSCLLQADIGVIDTRERVIVYETLLAMQLQAWDDSRVRFGFHPLHESIVLCSWVALNSEDHGAQLAAQLQALAAQVNAWREGPLAGRAFPRPRGGLSADTEISRMTLVNAV